MNIEQNSSRMRRSLISASALVLTSALVVAAPVAAFAHDGANTAPVAVADSYSVTQDEVFNLAAPGLLSNDGDVDGDVIQINGWNNASHGSVVLTSEGAMTYTPDAGYAGPDNFTYLVADEHGAQSALQTVTFDVIDGGVPVFVPPTVNTDIYWTQHDTTLIKSTGLTGVLGNDTGLPNSGFTLSVVTWTQHGQIALDPQMGGFMYVPAAGYSGFDSFVYQLSIPAENWSATGYVGINVYGANAGPIPLAVADSYATTKDVPLYVPAAGVLTNDIVDFGTLTATVSGLPGHGFVELTVDGAFIYTPDAGFVGTDTFEYQAGTAMPGYPQTGSAPALVTIVVNEAPAPQPGNDPQQAPTAQNDSYLAVSGDQLSVVALNGLLANDTDPNNVWITPVYLTQPTHGTLTELADGAFTYVSDAGFAGTDSFTYRVTEAGGLNPSNVATVAITVAPLVTGLDEPQVDGPQLPTEGQSTPTNLAQTGSESTGIVLLAFLLIYAGGMAIRFTRKATIQHSR